MAANAARDIQNILDKTPEGLPHRAEAMRQLTAATEGYSLEVLKLSANYVDLDEGQLRAILSTKRLSKEELETTVSTILLSKSEDVAAKSTNKLSLALTGLKTKIKELSTQLKQLALAHPAITSLVIALGALVAIGRINDAFTDSVDEAAERVENAKGKIADLNNEIETLKKKDSLTIVEQDRLDYLEAELSLQQQLLALEEKRYAKAQLGGTSFLGPWVAGKSDFSESGSYVDLYHKDFGIFNELFSPDAIGNVVAGYEEIEARLEGINEQIEIAKANNDDNALAIWGAQYDAAIDKAEGYYGTALTKASEYKAAITNLEADIEFGRYVKGTEEYEDAVKYLEVFKNSYTEALKIIAAEEIRTGSGHTAFDAVIEQSGVAKDYLVALAEDGSINNINDGLKSTVGPLAHVVKLLKEFNVPDEAFIDYLLDCVAATEELVDTTANYAPADIFAMEDADGTINDLGKISDELDTIQSAYQTLSEAMETYNSTGKITIDQLQSIVSQGDNFLDYLVNEEGALSLDEQALYNLAQARLAEMKMKIQSGIIDNVTGIQNEESALKYLASTNYDAARSYEELTKAKIEAWYTEARMDPTKYGGVGNVDKVYNKAVADWDKIDALFKNTDFTSLGSGATSKGTTDYKKLLDDEINLLQKQLDAGKITFKQYLDDRKALIQKYYDTGLIEAADYYSELEEYYQAQIDIYDRILSAVERRFDKEIEKIQETIEGIEKQNEALELQLEQQDAILSVVEEVYDKQIDTLKEQQDLLDDQIEKIRDEADENQKLLDIEEARKKLAEARTRRSVLLYTEQDGYIYTQNQEEIKQYEDELEGLEREQVIDELEKEKEKLQETIDQLEEYKEAWMEIPDLREQAANRELAIALWGQDYEQVILANRTETLESFKNNYIAIQDQIEDNTTLIESYNEKIEYYENLKVQWQEITDARQNALDDQLAAEYWGANWEAEILAGRQETLLAFKDVYINAQNEMATMAEEAARRIVEADKLAKSAGGSIGGDYTRENLPDNQDQEVLPGKSSLPELSKTFISPGYNTRGEAESKINVYGGDGVAQSKGDGKWYVYKYDTKNSGGRTKDFSVAAFATGGVITKEDESFLDPIAHSLGEDHMVAVKEGERVLTPAQNFLWEKYNLSEASLQSLRSFTPDIKPFNGLKQKNNGFDVRPVSVTYGDINIVMNGVNDTVSFAKVLKQQLPSIISQMN